MTTPPRIMWHPPTGRIAIHDPIHHGPPWTVPGYGRLTDAHMADGWMEMRLIPTSGGTT